MQLIIDSDWPSYNTCLLLNNCRIATKKVIFHKI